MTVISAQFSEVCLRELYMTAMYLIYSFTAPVGGIFLQIHTWDTTHWLGTVEVLLGSADNEEHIKWIAMSLSALSDPIRGTSLKIYMWDAIHPTIPGMKNSVTFRIYIVSDGRFFLKILICRLLTWKAVQLSVVLRISSEGRPWKFAPGQHTLPTKVYLHGRLVTALYSSRSLLFRLNPSSRWCHFSWKFVSVTQQTLATRDR